jgi:TPR repeat protein
MKPTFTATLGKTAFAGVLLLTFSGVAIAASPLDDGINAYRNGDFKKSASVFTPLARNGNATAQYLLSCQMINGIGIPADQDSGWEMLDHAAQAGHPDAEILQARRLEALQGSRHDIQTLYENAANKGSAQASMWLALDNLQNDRKDDARQHLDNAWAAGDPRAATMIATRFTTDPVEREKWLNQAAEHGELHAAAYLAQDYEKSDDRVKAVGWCAVASGLPGHNANIDWKKIGNAITKNCAQLDADMKPEARAANREKVDTFLHDFFASYQPWQPWRPCVVKPQ